MTKTCTKCNIEKALSQFSKHRHCKFGVRSWCKACSVLDISGWRVANKEKDKLTKNKYYQDNKPKIINQIRERSKLRRQTDPAFKLLCNLRRRLLNALHGNTKTLRTKELLGCTPEELKSYLSKLFEQGMTWENYGEWHVDHVIPCSSFNMLLEEDQKKCFHFNNLQPLWAVDNLKKSAKL